jgi:hypothetical protein
LAMQLETLEGLHRLAKEFVRESEKGPASRTPSVSDEELYDFYQKKALDYYSQCESLRRSPCTEPSH